MSCSEGELLYIVENLTFHLLRQIKNILYTINNILWLVLIKQGKCVQMVIEG